MPMDNALDNGQPHSGTLKFFFSMEPLEHAEQLVRVFHIESHAVVLDEIDAHSL